MAYPMDEIRDEYITAREKISYRKLAAKYNRAECEISEAGSREGWVKQREQYQSKTRAERRKKVEEEATDSAVELIRATKLLLVKTIAGINAEETLTPSASRGYSSTLKDIKDILDIKSAEDMEEQRARIDKLRRDAEREDKSASITVTLEGGLAEYGR